MGPGPATGAKVLFGPGTGGILWVQSSGLRHPAYESRTNGGAEGVSLVKPSEWFGAPGLGFGQ